MKSPYRLTVATAVHKGDRNYQQDRVAVLQHPYEKRCVLVVVADGMGGTSGGAIASGQVVQSAEDLLEQFDVEHGDPVHLMQQVLVDAHSVIRILKISSEHNPYSTMAAYVFMPDGRSYWIHSGDSRIYHFRRGHLLRRTRDHSYVQHLMDTGEITEREAINHPKSNVLASCLGVDARPLFDQTSVEPLKDGDVLLSCTDGLWGYCNEVEMAKIVEALSPTEACDRLLGLARERAEGRGDNVSMVILKTKIKRKGDD